MSALTDVDTLVYEPTSTYQNIRKSLGVQSLTPARALIAELVRRYSVLGLECTNLEIQKLSWFLHRVILAMGIGDPLRLEFKADKYGPYADRLRHLLNSPDGGFLHAEKRLPDAGPFERIAFADNRGEEVAAYLQSKRAAKYLPALEKASAVIDGFESPHGMELLATVDWLIHERHTPPSVPAIKMELQRWPGEAGAGARKLRLFDDRLLSLALTRLAKEESIDTRTY